MDGWKQRHGFSDGSTYSLGSLSLGLAWQDSPNRLGVRTGLRRAPIAVQRFGKGGTATLRLAWPESMQQAAWIIMARALGLGSSSTGDDLKVSGSPYGFPVDLISEIRPGEYYTLLNSHASDLNISMGTSGPATVETAWTYSDAVYADDGDPFDTAVEPSSTNPLPGRLASATLSGLPGLEIFDFQGRFTRSVTRSGIGSDGISTRVSLGPWTFEIQLGAYLKDDAAYAAAQAGGSHDLEVFFGSGSGSVKLSSPVIARPSTPDVQRERDGVIRLFLQPLQNHSNPPTFEVL